MSSRDEILRNIRRSGLAPTAHPGLQTNAIRFADREHQFIETLAGVGGAAHLADGLDEAQQVLQALPCMAEVGRAICLVPNLQLTFPPECSSSANVEYALPATEAHALADVDLAVLPGEFAVAENAAVWVDSSLGASRSLVFLAQHLVLVVPRSKLVDNLVDAYERLEFPGPGYGLFISGPSKTADIEQSLVIGAHGPRSQHVILV